MFDLSSQPRWPNWRWAFRQLKFYVAAAAISALGFLVISALLYGGGWVRAIASCASLAVVLIAIARTWAILRKWEVFRRAEDRVLERVTTGLATAQRKLAFAEEEFSIVTLEPTASTSGIFSNLLYRIITVLLRSLHAIVSRLHDKLANKQQSKGQPGLQ